MLKAVSNQASSYRNCLFLVYRIMFSKNLKSRVFWGENRKFFCKDRKQKIFLGIFIGSSPGLTTQIRTRPRVTQQGRIKCRRHIPVPAVPTQEAIPEEGGQKCIKSIQIFKFSINSYFAKFDNLMCSNLV